MPVISCENEISKSYSTRYIKITAIHAFNPVFGTVVSSSSNALLQIPMRDGNRASTSREKVEESHQYQTNGEFSQNETWLYHHLNHMRITDGFDSIDIDDVGPKRMVER